MGIVPLLALIPAALSAYAATQTPEARAARLQRRDAKRRAWCQQYGHMELEDLPKKALRPGGGWGGLLGPPRELRTQQTAVQGIPVSSPFGTRLHPTEGVLKKHEGIDIPVPKGTPIHAMWGGYVKRVDRDGEGKGTVNGNAVILGHRGGWTTAYLHLTLPMVKAGDTIAQGQLLGTSGSTGRSTGPHLHLAVFSPSGAAVDPARFFAPGTFTRS